MTALPISLRASILPARRLAFSLTGGQARNGHDTPTTITNEALRRSFQRGEWRGLPVYIFRTPDGEYDHAPSEIRHDLPGWRIVGRATVASCTQSTLFGTVEFSASSIAASVADLLDEELAARRIDFFSVPRPLQFSPEFTVVGDWTRHPERIRPEALALTRRPALGAYFFSFPRSANAGLHPNEATGSPGRV